LDCHWGPEHAETHGQNPEGVFHNSAETEPKKTDLGGSGMQDQKVESAVAFSI